MRYSCYANQTEPEIHLERGITDINNNKRIKYCMKNKNAHIDVLLLV